MDRKHRRGEGPAASSRRRRGRPRRGMGEHELIDRFTRVLPTRGEGVVLGPGDDAAVVRPPAGEDLVLTVDAVVEGVHFDEQFSPADVGWKALAVNLSDLAAMGARPLFALVALGQPGDASASRALGMARGLGACAREHRVAVVGGNVSRASEASLTVTAVGAVPRGRAVLRGGARAGDLVAVTGTLGDAALGLRPGAAPSLTRRQRRPRARLEAGRALSSLVTAAIDVSDGLVQDLGHVCRASGVGALVGVEDLPLSPAYRKATRLLREPWVTALAGGEDYELVVAVPPVSLGAARAAARRAGVTLTVVGRFVRGRGVTVVGARGQRIAVPAGYDHLRGGRRSLTNR